MLHFCWGGWCVIGMSFPIFAGFFEMNRWRVSILMSLFLVRNIAESGWNEKCGDEDISPVKPERPLKFGSLENPSLFIASDLPLITDANIFYKTSVLMSPLQSYWSKSSTNYQCSFKMFEVHVYCIITKG